MPRVYVPNPVNEKLEEAKQQLYLLKTVLEVESKERLSARLDDIRALLIEASEALDSSNEGR